MQYYGFPRPTLIEYLYSRRFVNHTNTLSSWLYKNIPYPLLWPGVLILQSNWTIFYYHTRFQCDELPWVSCLNMSMLNIHVSQGLVKHESMFNCLVRFTCFLLIGAYETKHNISSYLSTSVYVSIRIWRLVKMPCIKYYMDEKNDFYTRTSCVWSIGLFRAYTCRKLLRHGDAYRSTLIQVVAQHQAIIRTKTDLLPIRPLEQTWVNFQSKTNTLHSR